MMAASGWPSSSSCISTAPPRAASTVPLPRSSSRKASRTSRTRERGHPSGRVCTAWTPPRAAVRGTASCSSSAPRPSAPRAGTRRTTRLRAPILPPPRAPSSGPPELGRFAPSAVHPNGPWPPYASSSATSPSSSDMGLEASSGAPRRSVAPTPASPSSPSCSPCASSPPCPAAAPCSVSFPRSPASSRAPACPPPPLAAAAGLRAPAPPSTSMGLCCCAEASGLASPLAAGWGAPFSAAGFVGGLGGLLPCLIHLMPSAMSSKPLGMPSKAKRCFSDMRRMARQQ
mmetsp:Transcript_8839/g.30204  ORF Transcript_8839/g.30204 Transcript_8839/m.30204 type:complete len:286 (-) Transcript_8839:937-1794(-)